MAYTLAQAPTVANGGGSNTINKAFGSTVTAHSLLVAFLTTDASAPGTVAFSGGGTWQQVAAIREPVTTQWLIIGCCLDATGGTAATITATWTGNGAFNALMIGEFTNGGVASLLDTNTSGSLSTSATPTDSAMTTTSTDVAVSYCIAAASITISAGTGFTIGAQDGTNFAAWEYNLAAGPGSVTATFNFSGSQTWGIISAAFKSAGGGGVGGWPRIHTVRHQYSVV